jgi:hypothetical protein
MRNVDGAGPRHAIRRSGAGLRHVERWSGAGPRHAERQSGAGLHHAKFDGAQHPFQYYYSHVLQTQTV